MTQQEELNAIFERMAADYGALNANQQAFAIREFGRVRGDISDLLADFSNASNVVERRRLNRLLRELNEVETHLRDYGETALHRVVDDSAAFATRRINAGMREVTGSAAITMAQSRLNRNVTDYVIRRFSDDGLVLSDRIWRTAGDIRDELSKTLRSGIIRGDSVGEMVRDIRRVHANETWKIRRLVVTEGNTAYRTATAYNAKHSDVVRGLKLHPGVKMSPGCVNLSEEDRYGLGQGIFLPDDPDVYNPHPNCTSYVTYVLQNGGEIEE